MELGQGRVVIRVSFGIGIKVGIAGVERVRVGVGIRVSSIAFLPAGGTMEHQALLLSH